MKLSYAFGCYILEGAAEVPPGRWTPRGTTYRTSHLAEAAVYLPYADTGATARLEPYKSQQDALLAPSTATTHDDPTAFVAPLGKAYRPYQRAGIAFALARNRTLLADSPRLGKTPQSLGVVNNLPVGYPLLITCPATAKAHWAGEARDWLVGAPEIQVVSGTTPTPFLAPVVILNYDIAAAHKAEISRRSWRVWIADEARHLKTEKSERSKALWAIRAQWELFLDGTPTGTRTRDLWALIKRCDPDGLGSNRWAFIKRYCDGGYDETGRWDESGASNLAELQRRMRNKFMIRRTKRDVGHEIPPNRQFVCFDNAELQAVVAQEKQSLTPMQGESLADTLFRLDKEGGAPPAFLDARQALGLAMAPLCVEHVERLLAAGEQKVVVFAFHKAVVKRLKQAWPDAAVLVGETSPAQRVEAVRRFQEDAACRVFIGNHISAGQIISLSAANTTVFCELVWVPDTMDQCEERTWLPDKKESVESHWLYAAGSYNETMKDVVVARMEDAKRTLDKEHL